MGRFQHNAVIIAVKHNVVIDPFAGKLAIVESEQLRFRDFFPVAFEVGISRKQKGFVLKKGKKVFKKFVLA